MNECCLYACISRQIQRVFVYSFTPILTTILLHASTYRILRRGTALAMMLVVAGTFNAELRICRSFLGVLYATEVLSLSQRSGNSSMGPLQLIYMVEK